ncbi:MAG: FliH/SctL family protein [Vulcanimicrobiaceae bacterium]
MGKIVREAHFLDEKYVVVVPSIDHVDEPVRAGELDARFAAPFHEEHGQQPEVPSSAQAQVAPPVPHIDWDEVAAQADALIDRAARDAQDLLADAAARGRALLAQANERIVDIEQQTKLSAHEEGFEAGRIQIEAETASLISTLRALLDAAREERHTIVEGAEPELVRLAMAIAQSVVHQQIALDPNVVVENVRGALARLVAREVVTLRVNPIDLDTIRAHRDAIVASHDVEHLRIVEDQRVDRGGVVLETEAGTIDAKISTQLREARKALQSDESIELGASGGEGILHTPAQAS